MDYPEHEKLAEIREHSQTCGEFLDWLRQQCIQLCTWRAGGTNGKPRWIDDRTGEADGNFLSPHCIENPDYERWEEGWFPIGETIPQILARYFAIDLEKLDAEKQQMLEGQRALNERTRR